MKTWWTCLVVLIACSMLGACAEDEQKNKGKDKGGATVTKDEFKYPDKDDKAIVTTKSGLKYKDLAKGDGAEAQAGDVVQVHYTGWLKDGAKFDSSRDRGNPFRFPLGAGRVIKGWDEGVAGMKVGGKRKLIVPSELGYGARGAGGLIPPNSELVFDVELLQVGN
jgi:FKBP-type peptidyl-prolyl cis-trans isomerase FkpA